MITGHRHYRSI